MTDLREYHKSKCENQLSTNSVWDGVTVNDENVKRGFWKIGKVEEVIKGRDSVVRGAKVRVITKGKPVVINRPIQKLHPLEMKAQTLKLSLGADQDVNRSGGGQ